MVASGDDQVELVGLTVTGGSTGGEGGGIYNAATLTVTDCTLTGNAAYSGGGIYNSGTLTVTGSTLAGNASNSGGGIYNAGTLTIDGGMLADNASSTGGGIYNLGTLTIIGGTLEGNAAEGSRGGGIYNRGTLTLTGSTLMGNTAYGGRKGGGGGIYNDGLSTLAVVNSTFCGNSVHGDSASGGGIYNGGTTTIANSTFSDNSAEYGGGVYNTRNDQVFGSLTLNNSILWRNAGGELIGSSNMTASNNLIGIDPGFVRDPSDGGDGWGDDPATSDVDESANDDYGDLHLTAQSAAIDYGDNALAVDPDGNPLTTDLDGNPRNYNGSPVDVGAYEFQGHMAAGREEASLTVNTSEDVVDLYDGRVSLREAIHYAGSVLLGTTITFDPALEETNITLGGTALWIDRGLAIDGSALASLTIDANSRSRVFLIMQRDSQVVQFSNLTITGGSAPEGGGIYNTGVLTIVNCTLCGNSTNGSYGYGGGIYNMGVLTAANSTFSGNSAGYGGGIYTRGTLELNNTVVAENAAYSRSDIYQSYGTLTGSHNLIGDGTGQTALVHGTDGNLVGTSENPIDPLFIRNPSDGGDGWVGRLPHAGRGRISKQRLRRPATPGRIPRHGRGRRQPPSGRCIRPRRRRRHIRTDPVRPGRQRPGKRRIGRHGCVRILRPLGYPRRFEQRLYGQFRRPRYRPRQLEPGRLSGQPAGRRSVRRRVCRQRRSGYRSGELGCRARRGSRGRGV